MDAISISNLAFRWPGQADFCLDIPSFSVGMGERVFLHGPSGEGKSTLLGLLGGVLTPERGHIDLLGNTITRLNSTTRDSFRADHIGFIFQQFNLLPWLSAIDNVLLPCAFSTQRKERTGDAVSEAERLLRELDLTPADWNKHAAKLSVGQQQRVAAARALIGRPEILIADEPTSALDAARQQTFINLLLKETLQAGAALLFVSHDVRLATHFDRTVALADINQSSAAMIP